MRIQFILENEWPPLAWHLSLNWESGCVIRHGEQVDVWEDRFFEGVWDGDFENAAFDKAEHPCGSGAVITDEEVLLVPPFHPHERIYFSPERLDASNSLRCFLSVSGESLSPEVPCYKPFFLEALRGGASKKLPRLPLAGGQSVALLELHPWRLRRTGGERVEPIQRPCHFEEFRGYAQSMRSGMQRFVMNASAPGRRARFEPKVELSTGFDSVAVGVWAREVGVNVALSTTGVEDALGIGEQLGFDVRAKHLDEISNLPDSVFLEFCLLPLGRNIPMALHEGNHRGTLLFSGHGGDEMWGMKPAFQGSEIARPRDQILAGVSYTEYRLRVGLVVIPFPLYNQAHHEVIGAISQSEDMIRFRDADPDYCRPIPRRVGVERGLGWRDFGIAKQKGQIRFLSEFPASIRFAIQSFARTQQPSNSFLDYAMNWAHATAENPYSAKSKGFTSPLK